MNLHAINANPTTSLHSEVAQSTLQSFFWGVKKKGAYPQEEPAHFLKKPHFNIPARMDLLQCNESPALLPCTLMYSQQCS